MKACTQPSRYFASSDLYQLLGFFVRQTTPELAHALYVGSLMHDAHCIMHELGWSDEEAALLLEGFEHARCSAQSEEELFHAVRKDYTHLFSNPTFSVMTLFESRMSGPDKDARGNRIFFGQTLPSLKAFYERVGFETALKPRPREDHVSVELELMQALRRNQGNSLREGDEVAFAEVSRSCEEFLSGHVGRWAGSFFQGVESNANEEVYRAIGQLGTRFMRYELED